MWSIHRLQALVLLSCLLLPGAALAQEEMSFGGGESAEDESGGAEMDFGDPMGAGDGEEMSFGGPSEDQAASMNEAPAVDYRVAIIAVPTPEMTGEQRRALQRRLQDSIQMTQGYTLAGADAVLRGLEARGVATCITEPLCLGMVGSEAGVERILMGRVKQNAMGFGLDVDLFDVTDRLFLKYSTQTKLDDFDAVLEAVAPAYRDIFDIRVERQGPNYADQADVGKIQRILAYSSAGLAVASIGAGVLFGMQAGSLEDDILANETDDQGRFVDYSQRQAIADYRDAESKAQTANIFYGIGGGLAVVSAVLFIVQAGSDVAESDPNFAERSLDRIKLAPTVGQRSVGVGARFDF